MITEITQGQELPDLLQGADIFTNLQQGQITHAYKIDRYLEEGAFGCVRLITHRQTGIKRVMKLIRKDKISKEDEIRMLTQVNILYQLDHPNIVKLYELFQDSKYYYLIMEYLEGGEFFDKITQLHNVSERMVADYMKQIFSAVMYCHGQQIVHRDLKPENILFANKKNGANIKIIGFGTSRNMFGEQKITQKLPPPYYMAPEILIKNDTEKSDIWSCGVILYILLSGYPPFGGQESDIIHQIQSDFEQLIAFSPKRPCNNRCTINKSALIDVKRQTRCLVEQQYEFFLLLEFKFLEEGLLIRSLQNLSCLVLVMDLQILLTMLALDLAVSIRLFFDDEFLIIIFCSRSDFQSISILCSVYLPDKTSIALDHNQLWNCCNIPYLRIHYQYIL